MALVIDLIVMRKVSRVGEATLVKQASGMMKVKNHDSQVGQPQRIIHFRGPQGLDHGPPLITGAVMGIHGGCVPSPIFTSCVQGLNTNVADATLHIVHSGPTSVSNGENILWNATCGINVFCG